MANDERLSQIDRYIEDNVDQFIEKLGKLCAQPSISAQNVGIDACADLMATILEEEGFEADVVPSEGYPVVLGSGEGLTNRTLLFYLHYDVQPPEPLELWASPPFKLTRRGDKLFARGISDDKGHIVARLAALAAVRHTLGELPCDVKFVIEGEEEIGSPNMAAFVEAHKERLAADACIWEFGGVDGEGRPRQTLGMRGICYVELSVTTAVRDAHSGLGGSVFPNAAWRLVWALNSLKNEAEEVLIDGFYDNVVGPSERDLALLKKLPDESGMWQEMFGLNEFLKGVEGGLAWQTQAVFEPTCTICGLESGYQGAGTKTVLPAEARAKIDFRLVPDQTPEDVVEKLRAHLDAKDFADVEVRAFSGQRPAKVDPDDPFVQLVNRTASTVYGKEVVVEPMIGGSGPLYSFVEGLGLPVAAAGIAYPGTNGHAPNENVRLDYFLQGIRHTARVIEAFGRGAF